MKTFQNFKNKALKNKSFKKEYDALETEFKLIELLIQKRLNKGMSQKELAEAIGTKQSAISRFESGDYNPSLSFLSKLSGALGAKLKISI